MADKDPMEILEKISDMYDYAHDALKQFPRDERYALVSDIKHKIDVIIDLCIKRNLKGVQHRYRVGKIPLPRALSTVKGYVGMLQKVDSQELIDKICAETVLVRAEEAA